VGALQWRGFGELMQQHLADQRQDHIHPITQSPTKAISHANRACRPKDRSSFCVIFLCVLIFACVLPMNLAQRPFSTGLAVSQLAG
jgi:hypothetical protein